MGAADGSGHPRQGVYCLRQRPNRLDALVWRAGRRRYPHHEACTAAMRALVMHAAAMQYDDVTHDGQPEARTFSAIVARLRVATKEALEQIPLLRRRHAWPVVFDGNLRNG